MGGKGWADLTPWLIDFCQDDVPSYVTNLAKWNITGNLCGFGFVALASPMPLKVQKFINFGRLTRQKKLMKWLAHCCSQDKNHSAGRD